MSKRKKSAPVVRIERAANDEQSFCDVFDLLIGLHRDGGYAPLDVSKASANCFRMLAEGMVFVARLPDGTAIGTLAMTELTFWYAQDTFLQDAWFYVRPEYRKGHVGVALMRAARDDAQARGKIAFITVNNPDRKPKRTTMALESQTAGYVPVGHTIKIV